MRKTPLTMTNPQYVFLLVILAALLLYCTFQACNRHCGKFFADCIQCCCLLGDRQNSERNCIPMNNLTPRPTPQVPSIVINHPNPKQRESPPMYSMSRRMFPSGNRFQPFGNKVLASIPEGKGENKSLETNVSDSRAKREPSSIETKNCRYSESKVDLNNNNFVYGTGNKKDGEINQGKKGPERSLVTTISQKNNPKPMARQESRIKTSEIPCNLKETTDMNRETATGHILKLENNKLPESNEEPYYQNIVGKSVTGVRTFNEANRRLAISQGKSVSRRKRADSPVPDVKRRVTDERRRQHLSKYIVQNDIGEYLWPSYKTDKTFMEYNNQEQLLQKRTLGNYYGGPILKGVAKKSSSKLKPLPEHEVVSFSEDAGEKDLEQTGSTKVRNPSVPYGRVLNHLNRAPVLNLNGERSMTSKRKTLAGGTDKNMRMKFLNKDINPSKLRRNEKATNPSALCSGGLRIKTNLEGKKSITCKGDIASGDTENVLQFIIINDKNSSRPRGNEKAMIHIPPVLFRGDLSCKTKALLRNLNERGSITSERKIATGSAEDCLQLKFTTNGTNQSKPQGNEVTINPSALCGGDWCCKTKEKIWNLKKVEPITNKAETTARDTEDGLQFIIMNDTNPRMLQGNEETLNPSVLCRRDLGSETKSPFWNLNEGRSITSKRKIAAEGIKDDLHLKFIKNGTNLSKPQGNEEPINTSVICGEDMCFKTKAPLWNPKEGRSIRSKEETTAEGAKDGLQLIITNDTNPNKPQCNEEMMNHSVLSGGNLCCKAKTPVWNLKKERSNTSKGEFTVTSIEDSLQFIIRNDANPSKPQANEMVEDVEVKLSTEPLKRKQCSGIITKDTYSGRSIGSDYAKNGCSSSINCYDINSIPQENEMRKSMALQSPCFSLKGKQFIGNNNETVTSGTDNIPKYTNNVCNLKNKCNFIKDETCIPAKEKTDNISQRFLKETQLRKSCKLHACEKNPYLIPNKYLQNKVSSNNLNVSQHAEPSDSKFNMFNKRSSKELRNIRMKAKSIGNEIYGVDQMKEPGFSNEGNMYLSKPSKRNNVPNLSFSASSFTKDKPRNWASMNISEKRADEENDKEKVHTI